MQDSAKVKSPLQSRAEMYSYPLTLPVLRKLLSEARPLTIAPHAYVFREGDPADYICFIKTGQIKLSHINPQGKEDILLFVSGEDFIWDDGFLRQGRFFCSAIAMTETCLYRINRDPFLEALKDPEASLEIIRLMSAKLQAANERRQLVATSDPLARVAGFLLYHLEQGRDACICFHLEEIASSISLRMETVSRKLGELQTRQLIHREGKGKIRILDAEGLRLLYRGD